MTDYGVQPTGYVRKPISVILAELESAMVTEFGPGVIQTPQSPLGQLNGLIADLVAEVDERNLDIYQSYDPDQAEGTRLDTLARLRLISRGLETDFELRKSITNEGQARVDLQDLERSIKNIDGVTFAKVFVNESGEITNDVLQSGTVAVAVIGGDDELISYNMRKYIVPGINTYGNTRVTSELDGQCRSMSVIRPVLVPVTLQVNLRTTQDKFGCPAPSALTVKNFIEEKWLEDRINGLDVTFYTVRSIIEREFSNIEVVSIVGERDSQTYTSNQPVPISFIEIASIAADDITVSID